MTLPLYVEEIYGYITLKGARLSAILSDQRMQHNSRTPKLAAVCENIMVAYLRLLPLLGLLLADGTGVAAQGVQGVSKGQKSWTKESQSFFVPGAYIVEFEDENVGSLPAFPFL